MRVGEDCINLKRFKGLKRQERQKAVEHNFFRTLIKFRCAAAPREF
jgi:hypothetical protein